MHIPLAHLDARAPYRDTFAPAKITVKTVTPAPAMRAITDALEAPQMPVAIVTTAGKVWQLTSGGSGIVWVQSTGRFTPEQRDAVERITAAFEAEWPHLAPKALTGVVTPPEPFKPLQRLVEASEDAGLYKATTPPVKKAAAKKRARKKSAPKPTEIVEPQVWFQRPPGD